MFTTPFQSAIWIQSSEALQIETSHSLREARRKDFKGTEKNPAGWINTHDPTPNIITVGLKFLTLLKLLQIGRLGILFASKLMKAKGKSAL